MSTEFKIKLGLLLLLGAGGLYAAYRLKQGLGSMAALVPAVVKDGAEAVGQLGALAAHIATDPLDAFGVRPATTSSGVPAWEQTTPWQSSDPVSNNDSGVNFNYY